MIPAGTIRVRVVLSGLVQGVGLRPEIVRLARHFGLLGFVKNNAAGVVVEVQGASPAIAAFRVELLRKSSPPARIDEVTSCLLEPVESSGFEIALSDATPDRGIVPPDIATCENCLNDIQNPANRRRSYPFTTCCRCGPRYTIIEQLPFDRDSTSMAAFEMCPGCLTEYTDATDRRYHAQTISCFECGPTLILETEECEAARGASALDRTLELLEAGGIVAVKGVGGFHLACDGTNDAAVERLRNRKERSDKPFALMAASTAIVRLYASVGPTEARILESRERPIVLLRQCELPDALPLSQHVAPRSRELGFVLPYTPLHQLLMRDRPLVMTSGNTSNEPIVRENNQARQALGGIADALLLHDREIVAPCEDSVVRVVEGASYLIRRSRGYVPLPIHIDPIGSPVLAVGGDVKGSICLAASGQAFLGPHLGDMESPEMLNRLAETVDRFRNLLQIEPEVIACDAHPGYHTTGWAREFARRNGLPLVQVQHHRAHVAALMADGQRGEAMIGVCFDGTGYGDDGAIWGGEFFTATPSTMHREAHLSYVPLPGGDATIERPYRMALAWLHAAGIEWHSALPCLQACPAEERNLLRLQLACGLNCVPTSSVGRLFDAVSAMIGVCSQSTYEGQAAIELEAITEITEGEYEVDILPGSPLILDSRPVIRSVVGDLRNGVPAAVVAGRFHQGLARAVVNVCRLIRDQTGLHCVGLTGGVFQNATLLQMLIDQLRCESFEVLIHRQVPSNDGGLSLGQAVIAGSSNPRHA